MEITLEILYKGIQKLDSRMDNLEKSQQQGSRIGKEVATTIIMTVTNFYAHVLLNTKFGKDVQYNTSLYSQENAY